ncbi:MAG: glycosyltransferase family 2 protein [Phycisphaerales bacterium]|nr:glycosyltransferase family 2 protein [Phycisphaerales bacterium]
MHLAVVIPVYNERRTLPALVERVLAVPAPALPGGQGRCSRTIILVDDGSTDGSAELVRELGGREGFAAAVHERNRGKGAGLSTGFARALELGADLVIVQDADLEYDPGEHEAVLRPILDGRADVVIGSRFLGQTHRVLYYWHYVANRAITTFSNMLTNLNLTDVECCFKAFRAEALRQITIREARFGVEPELVAKVSRLRLASNPAEPGRLYPARIYEVPIGYSGRTYEEGKKITWRDGVSALRCIIRYNLLG